MPDILLTMPRLTGPELRNFLLDDIERFAEKCAPLIAPLRRLAGIDPIAADLLGQLEAGSELVDAHTTMPATIPAEELASILGSLTSLVRDANHRCCAHDLKQFVAPEQHQHLEFAALGLGQAMLYTYSRWAERIGTDHVGQLPIQLRRVICNAVHLAIADGAVHAQAHSEVPPWLQSQLAAMLGRVLDAGDMPTEREYAAGPWSMKAAFDTVIAIAAEWEQRAATTESDRYRRARSRSKNALLAHLDWAATAPLELPSFAEAFAIGHAYVMVQRLLDEVALASDAEPQRHLEAHLWFNLLTCDGDSRLVPG